MKTMSWILIFALLLYSGCSSTRFIEPEQSSYDELNKGTVWKEASITLTDGKEINEHNIRVDPDSTSWIRFKNKQVDTSEINTKGTLLGLILGGLIGASIGAMFFATEREWERSIGIKFFGVLGALIGLIVGTNKGSTDKYDLSVPKDSPLKDVEKSEAIVVSERVGRVINLEERNKYSLFIDIKRFQSAVLLKLPDGRYILKITYLDETMGEIGIKLLPQTESQILKLREHIEKFE